MILADQGKNRIPMNRQSVELASLLLCVLLRASGRGFAFPRPLRLASLHRAVMRVRLFVILAARTAKEMEYFLGIFGFTHDVLPFKTLLAEYYRALSRSSVAHTALRFVEPDK